MKIQSQILLEKKVSVKALNFFIPGYLTQHFADPEELPRTYQTQLQGCQTVVIQCSLSIVGLQQLQQWHLQKAHSDSQSKGGRQSEHSDMQILITDSSKATQHELWNCSADIKLFLQ